ncbi:hypothetical protein SIM22_05020 [Bacillus cereus group sp. BfR-BA-01363]|uniref:hypothetical protein n=1 Tax=Bacillus cereus group sp. BfR-BA-01363 TaxID=3094882 RepID=UPI0029C3A9C0|nr:hypothetical protein [Bacillus cereus group sp. BfR-BA-01363]MDX5853493.1 hypothetical protein [Bacillus cereus group sp. BfR-BA-01363]
MTQQNNEFMEKADEMLVPFEDEAKATILMSSLMNVFAQNGIDDMEQARMFVMQEIFKMFDNLTYTNLITIYSLTSQLNKNFASVKTRKNTQTNEKTFYTKDEMKRIARENYNKGREEGNKNEENLKETSLKKGVIKGRKELLNEIKNGDYPKLVEKLFMKKFEEGYEKANEEFRTVGFQTAYQRGYEKGISEKGGTIINSPMQLSKKDEYTKGFKDGFEKGKELRIKELRKMREWE